MITDTSQSAFARLQPVSVGDVSLKDGFWAPRRAANRAVTLPTQYQKLQATGRIDNFHRAAGAKTTPFQGLYFNDSDVYKWLEAAAWSLTDGESSATDGTLAMADAVIAAIVAAQRPDGYLDTYFMFDKAADRWTNLRDMHELYCAGHLMQAAVAHHRATGSRQLLEVAQRLADHICRVFGPPQSSKRPGTPGHPEIEMALVELSRQTGESQYLQQARYFLDSRGYGLIGGRDYHQDHRPFRQMERLAGHAVRALYLCAGATDIYAETGDAELRLALERLWHHMVSRQMYLSGGLGARYEGESFGADFELPNARAYSETCAAIANVMWNWRMLQLDGEARYADVMELALYNGVLAGISLDGEAYFYVNPLASDGRYQRQPWFECACCPPNIARLLAQLPGYFYSLSTDGVWLHLYAENTAAFTLPIGLNVELHQRTAYPWDGEITVTIGDRSDPGEFSLFLRLPAWLDAAEPGCTLTPRNQPPQRIPAPTQSYLEIRRVWHPADEVRLSLPMPVRFIESHPHLLENAGRAALMRGPLLYCLEAADNPGGDLRDVIVRKDAPVEVAFQPDMLGGVTLLRLQAEVRAPQSSWEGRLYRSRPCQPADSIPDPGVCSLTAIPYYAWANRAAGQMQVWLGVRQGKAEQL